jgi:hypothetical protein
MRQDCNLNVRQYSIALETRKRRTVGGKVRISEHVPNTDQFGLVTRLHNLRLNDDRLVLVAGLIIKRGSLFLSKGCLIEICLRRREQCRECPIDETGGEELRRASVRNLARGKWKNYAVDPSDIE